uniref:soluble epoxide hydrolase n=1 Tax=Davidia involucrata TaxID=16924 RepID=A0A5B7BQ49_DAVIN
MSDIIHRRVHSNGIWIHVAEKGKGPLVLLIHGFPELWSSWNYQIKCLAEHGYHVVAPDMRGYGDSDCPPDAASYTVFHLVGDLIGLLDELKEEQAFVVGHDWGAQVAWYLCLFRPDRVKALVNLGVPYMPRSPVKPIEFFTKTFGEGFYISQFQESGRAEKSFAQYDCLTILKKFLLINGPDLLAAPPGVEIIDFLDTPSSLPPWITEEELQTRASKFETSGFTGALNYYRAMDMNWKLLGPWEGGKISVPTKFIVGNKDMGFRSFGMQHYIEGEEFKSIVPNMDVVIIDGHHFIQQERAEQVTDEILSFFGNQSLV